MLPTDWLNALAGLLVGAIVGVTGVGGGSLMSPILILMFGVAPTTAVGTDLFFAAATKTVGSIVHHKQKSADHRIVGWLCLGSIPAAIVTLLLLFEFGGHQMKHGLIVTLLGAMLIVTSFCGVVIIDLPPTSLPSASFQPTGINFSCSFGSMIHTSEPASPP